MDIGAEIENVDVNCPPLTLYVDAICHVTVPRGTHVSLKVKVQHGGEKGERKEYEFANAGIIIRIKLFRMKH